MKRFFVLLAMILFSVMSHNALAGGAYIINSAGAPVLWQNDSSDKITVHPESGACGQFSSSAMLTRLANNLEQWTNVSTLDLGFTILSGSVPAVNGDNYTDYLAGVSGNTSQQNTANVQDGLNPILYDDDGEIVDAATGQNNGRFTILGFANPAGFTASSNDSSLITAIVEGQALFNCYCLEDSNGDPAHNDCSTAFTVDDLDFTMIHELGHFMNLDHTQVNSGLHDDGNEANDDFLPTMFPISLSAGNQLTPMEDDIMALSSNYPASSFFTQGNTSSTYCKVTGTLFDRFGEEMRCVDLQFTVADDPFSNVAFVSGAYAPATDENGDNDTVDDGECTSDCGDFTIYLKPGEVYSVAATAIDSGFVGGSGISPCANGQLPECTAAMISRCTDGNDATSCSSCVVSETLSTNSSGQSLATKIASECSKGAVVNLGSIISNSITTVSASTGGGGGGGSSSSASICSLNSSQNLVSVNPTAQVCILSGMVCFFALLRRVRAYKNF